MRRALALISSSFVPVSMLFMMLGEFVRNCEKFTVVNSEDCCRCVSCAYLVVRFKFAVVCSITNSLRRFLSTCVEQCVLLLAQWLSVVLHAS